MSLATFGLLGATTVGTGAQPAGAYPVEDTGCYTGVMTLRWRFDDAGGSWAAAPSGMQAAVEDGLDEWDGYTRRNGNVFIDSVRASADPNAIPVIRTAGTSSTTCSTSTGTPVMIRIGQSSSDWKRTARHEAGHAHGLSHSGDQDSSGGSSPSMVGCTLGGVIRSDDRAQYAHERDVGTRTANVGFENGSGYFDGAFAVSSAAPFKEIVTLSSAKGTLLDQLGRA